jgi:hypothetical protein
MMDLQSLRRSNWIWAVPITLALVFGLLVGYRLSPRSSVTPCVTLRVVYHDRVTDVAGTVFNGNQGGNEEFHQGSSTYVFKNQLPIPVKLMFPPIGYSFGGLIPITPQVVDVAQMPAFCQEQQIVQLGPLAEQSFESSYTITGTNPIEHFVFGCPRDGEKGVFVGDVASTPEIHAAKRSLKDSAAK